MIDLIGFIWKNEGVAGFFGGVKGMMVGQAIIKSVAFSTNAMALTYLTGAATTTPGTASSKLLLAAMFAGFVTSFLVSPIERIKVMMQADSTQSYHNELDCLRVVLRNEGWPGLLGRGLGPTLAREVPSYAIYFSTYGLLVQQLDVSQMLGASAPLVFGALAGMACWLPVYPIDVVKTLVQNTEGDNSNNSDSSSGAVVTTPPSTMATAKQLYEEGGIGAFFDGLTPKMLRAGVNHSITFWVYDILFVNIVKI